ncbi:MAG: hypothetical protein WKF80_10270 [Thermomicrobiales bacterium]
MTLAEAVALATFFAVLTIWHYGGGWFALATIAAIFAAWHIAQGDQP